MARNSTAGSEFGPLSAEVMDAVWKAGTPVSVRDVVSELNSRRSEPLAYTTVMTVMSRLANRETLVRKRVGRSFVYEATAADPAGLAVRNVIRTYGEAALTHFVDEAREDPAVLCRLRSLLAKK